MAQRILVADDSVAIQKAMKIAFAPLGVELHTASSQEELLQVGARVEPNLVILDANLKGVQGPQGLRTLLETFAPTPILLLEGSFEAVDRQALQACGFRAFLKKPFDWGELSEQVRALLGGSSKAPETAKAPSPSAGSPDGMESVIKSYCKEHFAPLMKEVIREELQKLSEEKTRSLSR